MNEMNILVGNYIYAKNMVYSPWVMGKLGAQGSSLVVENFIYRKTILVAYAFLLVSFSY